MRKFDHFANAGKMVDAEARSRGEENKMKQITHQEAMRIAQETLETAERERIEVARAEARRGIQYNGQEQEQTDVKDKD